MELTPENFKTVVEDPNTDVLIEFYAPCKSLAFFPTTLSFLALSHFLSAAPPPPPPPSGRDTSELMRKLTIRRQKIEEQIKDRADMDDDQDTVRQGEGLTFGSAPSSSERNSTASIQSELVVSYSTRDSQDGLDGVETRRVGGSGRDPNSLAKYGIIEDETGGSFVV